MLSGRQLWRSMIQKTIGVMVLVDLKWNYNSSAWFWEYKLLCMWESALEMGYEKGWRLCNYIDKEILIFIFIFIPVFSNANIAIRFWYIKWICNIIGFKWYCCSYYQGNCLMLMNIIGYNLAWLWVIASCYYVGIFWPRFWK